MLDINKRKFIFCCCSLPIYFSKNYVFSDNKNFDYLVKGPLAGSIYYTKKKPGRWKNLLTSHIPIMKIKSNFIEITTT